MVKSTVCRYEHFHENWYTTWADRLDLEKAGQDLTRPDRQIGRKAWEWCAIAAALEERGFLQSGRDGIGFAVGREVLPSAFAACGVNVLATDLATDEAGWTEAQHAKKAEDLFYPKLVDQQTFADKVQFRGADMRDISDFDDECCDFVWSSCSFEHLGGLDAGLDFVKSGMRLIKPGGIAIHTTEFNVSSNTDTVETGGSVIYRKCDIQKLDYELRLMNCAIEDLDFNPGSHRHDIEYDYPPYFTHSRKHVKLLLSSYVSTSIILIIHKWHSI